MDIICIDVTGLHFVLQDCKVCDNRVSKLFVGAPIKLINNFNDRQLRQGVCIAPRYLLDCLQCSVIKVRSDLNNSNSGQCSVCCLCHQCL